MKSLLLIILIAALAWFGYQYYQEHRAAPVKIEKSESTPSVSTNNFKIQKCVTADGRVIYLDHTKEGQCKNVITETKTLHIVHNEKNSSNSGTTANSIETPTTKSEFKCDGRTHCGQMHSCEEATYFLQHCPNTEMDGDRDGKPCEEQWCGH